MRHISEDESSSMSKMIGKQIYPIGRHKKNENHRGGVITCKMTCWRPLVHRVVKVKGARIVAFEESEGADDGEVKLGDNGQWTSEDERCKIESVDIHRGLRHRLGRMIKQIWRPRRRD